MNRVKFDYVISAINMMNVHRKHYYESPEKIAIYKESLTELMSIVNASLKGKLNSIDNSVSILYNAFTEGNALECYDKVNRLSAELVYADSGGLQIVTAGKEITESLKDDIYKIQAQSDRAMCFDVIPLRTVTLVRGKTERANVSNKVFDSHLHRDAGQATGRNILRQCQIFDKINASAKVMVIVQGNRADDMVMYFDEIQKQIPKDLHRYIGGIALADTCMGNGELESIEMLKAGHIVSRDFDPVYSQHLHLLGVGSISRMKPVIYLSKSNFLDSFNRISYDSTSHSSTLLFGRFFNKGKQKPIGKVRSPHSEQVFTQIYKFFESYISKLCTLDEFIDFAYDDTGKLTTTSIANRSKDMKLEHFAAAASLAVMYVYYQVHDFIVLLDEAWTNSEKDHSTIGRLQNVKTLQDLNWWYDTFSHSVESTRIKRQDELATLENFFE